MSWRIPSTLCEGVMVEIDGVAMEFRIYSSKEKSAAKKGHNRAIPGEIKGKKLSSLRPARPVPTWRGLACPSRAGKDRGAARDGGQACAGQKTQASKKPFILDKL